jgi:hypothetical protein
MGEEGRDRVELDRIGASIVAGVERCLPEWARSQSARILDAWGRIGGGRRAEVEAEARAAGEVAAARVSGELRMLFAADPAEQRATPLEIVRTAYREPTAVLRDAGVPPVVRDEFDERAWPEDRYGLVPRTLGDLGDEDLGPLHLAWGLAKTKLLRAGAGES